MKRAYNLLQADLKADLKPLGLRIGLFSALAVIAENPGARASQVAACMSVERANLVTLLDELTSKGWVERRPCPTDGRAQDLFLTSAGKALYRKARKVVEDQDARMLGALGPEVARLVNEGLRDIEANAKKSIHGEGTSR